MQDSNIVSIKNLFLTRLNTLQHLLNLGAEKFKTDPDSILDFRIADDMFPLGTQISFTCNQPHNFSLWCEGKNIKDLDPQIKTISTAKKIINDTNTRVENIQALDTKLEEIKRIEFGGGRYVELAGVNYVNEFLIPNFYFHLVTTYNILRMQGVAVGKANYMSHLGPLVKQA